MPVLPLQNRTPLYLRNFMKLYGQLLQNSRSPRQRILIGTLTQMIRYRTWFIHRCTR